VVVVVVVVVVVKSVLVVVAVVVTDVRNDVVITVVVVLPEMVVTTVTVERPEAVAARALPVADSIRATAGGVTAAKRPAFSRNKRRSESADFRLMPSPDIPAPPATFPGQSEIRSTSAALGKLSLLTTL
jgi:hypothetical protein